MAGRPPVGKAVQLKSVCVLLATAWPNLFKCLRLWFWQKTHFCCLSRAALCLCCFCSVGANIWLRPFVLSSYLLHRPFSFPFPSRALLSRWKSVCTPRGQKGFQSMQLGPAAWMLSKLLCELNVFACSSAKLTWERPLPLAAMRRVVKANFALLSFQCLRGLSPSLQD